MRGVGPFAVYEPAAGQYYSWAGAMSQLNGHVQALGTFPSSLELWLSPLACSLPGTRGGYFSGATKGTFRKCQLGLAR